MSDFNEQLAAITDEIAALEEGRIKALTELGELALPELKGKKEFSEPIAKIEEMDTKIGELKENKTALEARKVEFEREERERTVRRTCFSCNRINPEGAKFCETCGAKIGELPREFCKSCGTLNPSGLKFCGECGNKLDDV